MEKLTYSSFEKLFIILEFRLLYILEMRKISLLFSILSAVLFFGFQAEAEEVDRGSSCKRDWTEWVQPGYDIGPWLSQFNEKIRQQPGYNELFFIWPRPLRARYGALSDATPSLDFEEVAYSFRVTDEGGFENLNLRVGTGKAVVDTRIKELICSAAPLKPPTNLPANKKLGIMVVIKNDGRQLSIRSYIPR